MGSAIGKSKKIILNKYERYTLENLQALLLKEYVNEENKFYFENSHVKLGSSKEDMIESFRNSDGKEMDFWDYARLNLRNANNNLQIFLYTRKKISVSTLDSGKKSAEESISENGLENSRNIANVPVLQNKFNDLSIEKKEESKEHSKDKKIIQSLSPSPHYSDVSSSSIDLNKNCFLRNNTAFKIGANWVKRDELQMNSVIGQ